MAQPQWYDFVSNGIILPLRAQIRRVIGDNNHRFEPGTPHENPHFVTPQGFGLASIYLESRRVLIPGAQSVLGVLLPFKMGLMLNINGHTIHLHGVGSSEENGGFWTRVIYPLSQILGGSMNKSVPITKNEPVRFHSPVPIEELGGVFTLDLPYDEVRLDYVGTLEVRRVPLTPHE